MLNQEKRFKINLEITFSIDFLFKIYSRRSISISYCMQTVFGFKFIIMVLLSKCRSS